MYQHTKGNKDSDKMNPYLVIGLDWGASSPSWYRLPPGNLWEPWCPLSEFWQPLFYCSASILLHTHLHTVLHLQWINLDLNKSVAPSKWKNAPFNPAVPSLTYWPSLCFMAISVLSISHLSGSGLRPNTVGFWRFGAGYRRVVTRPSEWMEWWWTSSARVLNLCSAVT